MYNTEIFKEKAFKIHGDKYDYSMVNYINSKTSVEIFCKKHNIFFEQKPIYHLRGALCKKCGYDKQKSTTSDFIIKARKVHGDIYDYSLVNYYDTLTKVKIVCKEHGEFEQKPLGHLYGQGCAKCFHDTIRLSKEECIINSKKVHGEKYDYSLVEYIDNLTKIKIICPEHGIFEQQPSNHMEGNGCIKCRHQSRRNNSYIKKCNEKFNNKYDYSLVDYVNNNTRVDIICPEHGIFKQSMKSHLKHDGCPFCSGKKMNTEFFILNSSKKHNNYFDYSLVEYTGAFKKVKIKCPEHGLFEQMPSTHLFGAGCPVCKSSKGEKSIISFLNENNIEYKHQYAFEKCKNINVLFFDFYIPDRNMCIEYNGMQHYKKIEYFGGDKGFKITKKRDNIKKAFCKKNKISLKIITYKDNILEKLNKIFKSNI
jgi:hypothetical protein